ncbi:MAG TPA: CHASE sensor domain-containing protein, partial [Burkholderiaceae bacterium]|nr:CHASE sensor domain-containing protein [Burkholderiaceae bacterium]
MIWALQSRAVPLRERLATIHRQTLLLAMTLVFVLVAVGMIGITVGARMQSAQVQARVLADNLSAAVAFGDAKAAGESLQSLRHEHNILHASVSDVQGRVLAAYRRAGEGAPPPATPRGTTLDLDWQRLVVVAPVTTPLGEAGRVEIVVGLSSLYRDGLWLMLAMLVSVLVASAAGTLLLRRLSRSVIDPLSALTQVAREVATSADFAHRAEGSRIVELDTLARSFNTMLDQIQDR